MGARAKLLGLAFAGLVTTASAAELPITGTYGDENGCRREHGSQPGLTLTADGFEGQEWGCSFESITPVDAKPIENATAWIVLAWCSVEGTSYPKMLGVERDPNNPSFLILSSDDVNGEFWPPVTVKPCDEGQAK